MSGDPIQSTTTLNALQYVVARYASSASGAPNLYAVERFALIGAHLDCRSLTLAIAQFEADWAKREVARHAEEWQSHVDLTKRLRAGELPPGIGQKSIEAAKRACSAIFGELPTEASPRAVPSRQLEKSE